MKQVSDIAAEILYPKEATDDTVLVESTEEIQEAVDIKAIIKELIDTSWAGSNESQMKAVQLLKGVALSDEPEANAFMKSLDKFTSGMKE